jgi:hypothetical protein
MAVNGSDTRQKKWLEIIVQLVSSRSVGIDCRGISIEKVDCRRTVMINGYKTRYVCTWLSTHSYLVLPRQEFSSETRKLAWDRAVLSDDNRIVQVGVKRRKYGYG